MYKQICTIIAQWSNLVNLSKKRYKFVFLVFLLSIYYTNMFLYSDAQLEPEWTEKIPLKKANQKFMLGFPPLSWWRHLSFWLVFRVFKRICFKKSDYVNEWKDVVGVILSLTSQQGSFLSLDYLLNSCQDTLYQIKCEDGWLQNLQKCHANTVNCVHCITELMWINTQNNIPESAFLVSCWAASHSQLLLCRLML